MFVVMSSAHVVVITGSTRGIGKGMAEHFLRRGHHVVISGRTAEAVQSACDELQAVAREGAEILGVACDVSQRSELQRLWQESAAAFGRIDIWINNAGVSNSRQRGGEMQGADIQAVQRINLAGVLHATQVALAGMSQQASKGTIYNMEGFGSNGMMRPGMSLYGASKYALTYFTKALLAETQTSGVRICYLSPGIVLTDLLKRDMGAPDSPEFERNRKIYEILADPVDTVAPWLVEKVLDNRSNGSRIAWLTSGKAAGRFLGSLFRRRQVLTDADFRSR